MNSLERFAKQIRELLATMTPAARIMAALLAGVIVVSLGWIVSTQQSSQSEYLLGGQSFSEEQLNKMERALGESGLRKYERIGNRLKVPTTERDIYVKALAEGNAMPDDWDSAVAAELALSGNPLLSPSVVADRIKYAKQRDLAKILQTIPGIEKAYVQYESKEARFGRDAQQTASVYLKGNHNERISQDTMRQISRAVTAHFPGLKPENVVVSDLNSTHTFQATSDPMAADQQLYLQAQRQWEEYYEDKVAPELSVYGDVKLGVIVELDPTLKKEMEQLKYDPVGTAAKQMNQRKDTKSAKAAPGGRPGAEPNGAGGANKSQSLSAPVDQTAESKESQEDLQSVVGHQATLTKEAPLTPKRVSFTVGVPESYFHKVSLQRFLQSDAGQGKTAKDLPPLTDVELTKLKKETEDNIRSAIEGQLPQVRQGDDRFDLVKVYNYMDLPEPEVPAATLAQTSLAWLQKSWTTLGLFALVGITLAMMFSWVRAQAAPESDKEFAEGFGLEVPASMGDSLELGDDAAGSGSEEGEPKFQITGGEIKEELSSLIKQNPDAAVNLLRTWIGEVAA
jgi:flagellar M-ring protein FliF